MKTKITHTLTVLTLALSTSFVSAKEFDLGEDWKANIGLQLQAFALQTSNDIPSDPTQEDSFRVISGFDPSKLTVSLTAPETNGLTVSGTFQVVTNITSGKSEGSPDGGNLFGVRVAEIAVSGDFGTIKAGRGWQIMGSHSLLHHTSALPGVGGTSAGACGDFDGNDSKFSGGCGLIGYGYVWTNFASGIQFVSNDYDGFGYRVGIFEPLGGSEADSPRFEGEVSYKKEAFDLWASFVNQSAGSEGNISAYDVGFEGRARGFALTGTYTAGEGIDSGFRGPSSNDSTFYSIELDYTHKNTTFGAAFGTTETENDAGEMLIDADITTVFVHYKLNSYITIVGEWVTEDVKDTDEISHVALGAQLFF